MKYPVAEALTAYYSVLALISGLALGSAVWCAPSEPAAEPHAPLDACARACGKWIAAGCKDGDSVCQAFGEDGECQAFISCEQSCREEPQAYPLAACVAELGQVRDCEEPCK